MCVALYLAWYRPLLSFCGLPFRSETVLRQRRMVHRSEREEFESEKQGNEEIAPATNRFVGSPEGEEGESFFSAE